MNKLNDISHYINMIDIDDNKRKSIGFLFELQRENIKGFLIEELNLLHKSIVANKDTENVDENIGRVKAMTEFIKILDKF